MKLNNKYYIIRHGEAISNVKGFLSCWPEKIKNPLSKKGVKQVKIAAKKLKNKGINLIFTSPLLRAKQTAQIIGKTLKIKPKIDKRLREICFGSFNLKPFQQYENYITHTKKTKKAVPGGENYTQVLKRVSDFLESVEKKYKNKNILVVSHQCPLSLLESKFKGFSIFETATKTPPERTLNKGEIRKLN